MGHPRKRALAVLAILCALTMLASALAVSASASATSTALPATSSGSLASTSSVSPTVAAHTSFVIQGTASASSSPISSSGGDTIVVFASIWSTNTVGAVTDSAGDSFTQLGYTTETFSGGTFGLAIFAAYSVAGGSSVTVTVTLSGSTSSADAAVNVVDVTGVASAPLAQFGTFTESTQSGQTNGLCDNQISAAANDLVLAGVGSHNSATWTASGVDSRIDNVNAAITGVTMTAADFQYTATSSSSVWMNGTSSIGYSQWIANSLVLTPGAALASPPQYPVTFTESGLSSGTSWTVTLAGAANSTTAPNGIGFQEPNGTYSFSVGTVAGYSANPSTGSVTVNGAAASEAIAFTVDSSDSSVAPTVAAHTSFAVTASSGTSSGIPSTAGDTIVVFAGIWSTNTVGAVTDSAGDSFTQLGYTTETFSGGTFGLAIFAAYDVAGGSSVTVTVTLSGSTSSADAAVNVVDVTGVAAAPLAQFGTFTESTQSGQTNRVFDNQISASTNDLVLAGVGSHNSAIWTASGVDSRIDNVNAVISGVTMTAADFQYTATSSGSVWMNGTSSIGYSQWIANSLVLTPGAAVPPPPQYPVTFTESGLSSGTSWTVTLAGASNSTTAPNGIGFQEPNGTYSFSVGTVAGYSVSPSTGSVTVNGAAVSEAITFTLLPPQAKYAVTFTESGLPNGTSWTVILAGASNSTTAPNGLGFQEPNGSYSFTIGAVAGYSASPSSGSLTVNGAAVSQAIAFSVATTSQSITHVVLIIMENEELSTVLKYAPYQSYLYHTYGKATNFYAACHDSPHAYLIATNGRDFGCPAPIPKENVTNIADLFQGAGLTWTGYFESLPASDYCGEKSVGVFLNYHNPFQYYSDIIDNSSKTRCTQNILNSASFNSSVAAGTLPTFSLYIPNSCNDGNTACGGNGTSHVDLTRQGDAWLQSFLSPILNHTGADASAAEQTLVAHTAFLITYDEGTTGNGYNNGYVMSPGKWSCNTKTYQTACAGHIPMIVVSPYSIGTKYTANADQVQVLSTIEWLFGLPSDGGLDSSSTAASNLFPPMTSLFSFTSNGYAPATPVAIMPAAQSTSTLPVPLEVRSGVPFSGAFLAIGFLGTLVIARWKPSRRR